MFVKIMRHQTKTFFTFKNVKISTRNISNRPDFTKNRYKITRGNYNYLHEEHIHYFQNLLGESRIVMDLSDLEKYNVDWFNQVRGCSSIVLKPKTTEEVSNILRFCDLNKLAVCPQGGNTSVLGGSVPVFDEVIISTELMNEIVDLDEHSGVITCQAGCILENIDNYLETKGLIVPLDLGAKGTCHIGGNVSTNAGGMRLIQFGNMHGNILGIEAVKANGDVVDCLSTLKKDNTGYHLKHLFIGSEGTLGFVTKVALQCPARPKFRNVAFLGLQNFVKVLKTFKLLRQRLAEILSAVEVIDTPTMEFIKNVNSQNSPIGEYPFYLMIETSGSNERHDEEKLSGFFEEAIHKGLVLNGIVANEPAKIQKIWSVRENIANGFKARGSKMLQYDISLPFKDYYNIMEPIREYTKDVSETVFGFGHMGDGNLHLQIILKSDVTEKIRSKINDFVFEKILELKGSISAEHGIGLLKAKYMDKIKPQSSIKLMKSVKKLMDPNGILNPYKVLL
ncbi:unnamed protein product [Psylliodes chrysocephalus]|uniref:D-2-hydroxyglutarate dehydrogenase, mitochondrial n=1 Tax=Psylliodes chrysocephalus TaxID=3402493 RepID=A0A9P0GDL9_9CUCU|nr:unnamed protein product [Psylliodes chrysocephala]